MTKIHSLQSINESIKQKFKGRRLVFGSGGTKAKVFFVGEIPDDHEEKKGKAFVGPTGRALNALLKKISLDKRRVYATHVLKYRPSAKRLPSAKEVKSHMPFLKEEIKTINPLIVVTLGNMALNGVGLKFPLVNVHGRTFNFGEYTLLPTYNPVRALDNPELQTTIEAEFLKLKQILEKREKEQETQA